MEVYGKFSKTEKFTSFTFISASDFSLILDEVVDVEADRRRLVQQIGRGEENARYLQKQLENSDFVNKAPEQVVAATRERHAEAVQQLEKLQEKLDGLTQP